ncbi:MAG: Gfo/Idh/MocA family oxidoreductase [Balneolaceae bacterium]|nr:Gfo/Idh/MocA family oxidoreductase [Balneolaceae bacterium]
MSIITATCTEMENNDDIDVAYIVVPTGLHARYAITAAFAGKHVWCEKPMALTVEECQSIIDAADKNGVHLSIGYRMQHEPNTKTIMRYAQEETYGAVTGVKTGAGYDGSHPEGNWRRDAELGGGALYDMGVYPINAARYSTQMEPIRARGVQKSDRYEMYDEVDETTTFELEVRWRDGTGRNQFGKSMNYLDVTCTDGWYNLRPFQSYSGVQGETSDGKKLPPDPNHQQARQMDNEALAIIEGRDPIVPASEGIKDIRTVQAIMESSRHNRRWVEL